MINNNKILTVSYGTFSCTLEGFDDSFGTMKAIAEYFRDLSADDRYFGAEPAQPDAQMLARIAQREISRHVEAREDEGRIVLSAKDADQAAALLASARDENAAEAEPQAEAEVTAEKVAPTSEPQEAVKPAPKAKRKLVKPVVKVIQEAEPKISDAEAKADDIIEDVPAEVVMAVVQDEPDIVPSLPDADVEAFFADNASSKADEFYATEDALDNAPEQERAKADSIADKLKRIRAVVSQQSDATAPDYSEDQHAEAGLATAAPLADLDLEDDQFEDDSFEDEQNDVLADTLRDLEDALDADDAIDAQDDLDGDLADEDDDITAILSRLEQESDDDASALQEEFNEADHDDDLESDILAAMDSIVAAPDADDLDDLGDDNLFDEAEETIAEAAPAPQPEKPAAPAVRSRVLKVKRATLEAAIEAGQLEEYDEDEEAAPAPKPSLRKTPRPTRSSLSAEAEDELARELAELEADIETTEQSAVDVALDRHVAEDAPKPVRTEISRDADDDLSRLMQETDSQMDEPEGATRRDAFAHLRAAVAAKKADEAVGGGLGDEDSDEAYRDDLANVVRPRRPVSGEGNRTQRPAEQRPAPLKLVAEQRIDVAHSASVAPVRPRRVAAVTNAPAPTTTSDAASFADFAADVGAQKLPDLLEAAAAYLSFVEGHEQFSRPQLMTKVRQVEKENFTREESLRSFGKLLREGKIQKLKGGRFQASDQIGFIQDARAAG